MYIDRRANKNNIRVNNATSGFEDTSIVMSEFVIIGTNLYEAYSIPVSLANSTISYNIYVYKDGFYGTFAITNTTPSGNNPKFMQAKLAYEDNDITSYQTISGGTTQTLTVPIGSRLPTATSLLQLKLIFESGVSGVNTSDADDLVGFNVVRSTNNSLQSENTFELDISSGFINNGVLELILDLFDTPPANTGWYGTLYINNEAGSQAPMFFRLNVVNDGIETSLYNIDGGFDGLGEGSSFNIEVPEANRLTNISSRIKLIYNLDGAQMDNIDASNIIYESGGPYDADKYIDFAIEEPYLNGVTLTINFLIIY